MRTTSIAVGVALIGTCLGLRPGRTAAGTGRFWNGECRRRPGNRACGRREGDRRAGRSLSRKRSTRATPRRPPRPSRRTPSSSTSRASGPKAARASATSWPRRSRIIPAARSPSRRRPCVSSAPTRRSRRAGRPSLRPGSGRRRSLASPSSTSSTMATGSSRPSATSIARDLTPHERLKELEWMVGDWINESQDAVVLTTCKWADGGNFLVREFTMKTQGQPVLSGTQRIGWDPTRHQFKTWIFDTEGGFGEGYWTRNGDQWVIKAEGVRQDGQHASATNIITRLGKDRRTGSRSTGPSAAPRCPGSTSSRSCGSHPRPASKATRRVQHHLLSSRIFIMNRTLSKLALGTHWFSSPPVRRPRGSAAAAVAGGGGGYGGGGDRGGGQMGGGSMGHSPSFSQPHSPSSQSGSSSYHPQSGNQGSSSHNAGSAAAGAGYANNNQAVEPQRGCRRRRGLRQPQPELVEPQRGSCRRRRRATPTATRARRTINAGAAAAGAGYANRNQGSQYPNAGAAAAGAGYANRNQGSQYPNAGAAAAGAGYANNHNGYWNGNNYARLGGDGTGHGLRERGRGLGRRLADVRLGLFGLQQSLLWRRLRVERRCADRGRAAARRFAAVDRGAGYQLLPADQHDRRATRSGRRRPGDCGVRPGPRGVQGGRLRPGPSARPAGPRPDAQ